MTQLHRRPMEILPPLRFLMAVSVVGGHMWHGAFGDAGQHAVMGFFAISGYLITRISLGAYRGRPLSFLFNRALRIYPQYWVAIALETWVVWRNPLFAHQFNGAFSIPPNRLEWAKQFFVFGLDGAPERLSPPTWSLNVELYFYLLIGLVTHRSERLTYAAFVITCALGVMAVTGLVPFPFYGSPMGNGFVFFAGSSAYFLAQRFTPPIWLGCAMLTLYALSGYVLTRFIGTAPMDEDAALTLSALAIAIMLIRPPQITPANPASINLLGRLSYPLFLIHWASATLILPLVGHRGPELFFGTLTLSLALASIMVWGVDLPVEHLRRRVRWHPLHLR